VLVTVINGDRRVDIKIKGHGRKALARAEETAARLMAAGPEAEPPMPVPAFGYSVGADHDQSYQYPGDHHAE
jgi:hypothetical protein